MTHIKKIKDERGQVFIQVELVTTSFFPYPNGSFFRYNASVKHIPKGKRNERNNPIIATEDEIQAAKLELWEIVKP